MRLKWRNGKGKRDQSGVHRKMSQQMSRAGHTSIAVQPILIQRRLNTHQDFCHNSNSLKGSSGSSLYPAPIVRSRPGHLIEH